MPPDCRVGASRETAELAGGFSARGDNHRCEEACTIACGSSEAQRRAAARRRCCKERKERRSNGQHRNYGKPYPNFLVRRSAIVFSHQNPPDSRPQVQCDCVTARQPVIPSGDKVSPGLDFVSEISSAEKFEGARFNPESLGCLY